MNLELVEKLQKLRKDNNLSQEQLAEKIGVSRQAISKWERGEATPDSDNLICLAKIYNISLDELISSKENNNMNEESKKTKLMKIKDYVLVALLFIVTIIYLILGFTLSLWHPGWLLYFLPVIITSILDVIDKKSVSEFAFPLLIAGIYLVLGFFWNLWHPGWVVFILIPVFYIVCNFLKKK
mgnify:CR=1 FL=1